MLIMGCTLVFVMMVILLMRVTTNMVVRSIVVIREFFDLNKVGYTLLLFAMMVTVMVAMMAYHNFC